MEPTTIERKTLVSIKSFDDIATLNQRYNITKQHFIYHKDVADFVYDYVEKYGDAPSHTLLEAEFSTFDTSGEESNFDYIANEFRKTVTAREAAIIFYTGQETIEKDPDGALPSVIARLQSLIRVDEDRRNILDAETSSDRLQNYKDKVENPYNFNIKIGIEPLDDIPLYIAPEMLIGLFADTSVGKSWFAMRIAAEFYKQGYKVVILSPELSVEQLNIRADVLLAYQRGYQLSHMGLTMGRDIQGLEEVYGEFLKSLPDDGRWVNLEATPEDHITLSSISALIQKEKPFLLVVDSILELEDEGRQRNTWEQMESKVKGLKALARKHKIIILVTNQATRPENNKEGAARINEVAYGYAFARGVDLLISFGYITDSGSIREVQIPKIRTGEASTKAYQIIYDPDIGDIGRSAGAISEVDFANRVGNI